MTMTHSIKASETSAGTSLDLATCVSPDELKQYLSGWCDDAQAERIEIHLATCNLCEQALKELDIKPDTLLQSLQSTAVEKAFTKDDVASSLAAEQPVDAALAKARRLMDAPVESSAADKLRAVWQPANRELGVYELLRPLGRGGMGAVYLANHRQLQKQVAIKLLPVLSAEDSDVRARFQREIRVVGKLKHPSIVAATDAGEIDGTQFLVMEYVPGLDLSRLARLLGKLPVADASELMRQVALGLSSAHAEGVVHRDVKPSNLMLDETGRIRILDFGLAQLSVWDEASVDLTTVGQLMGTLDYMAPEQAEFGGNVDYRADLYALGATLFRLLCGRPPLAAAPNQSPLEKLRMLANHQSPKLDTLCPEAPAALVALVGSLLSRNPQDRPASAAHVAEQLAAFTVSADLVGLLKRAQSKAAESPELLKPEKLAIFAKPSFDPPLAAESPPPNSRHIVRWLLAAALPLLVVAGILIKLETDKGQLVIESDIDNIKVRIVSNGKPVSGLTINHGTTATRLRADKYEVTIDGPSDGLTIENEQFTIKNGETVVARIQQLPTLMAQTKAMPDQSAANATGAGVTSDPLTAMRQKLWELEVELQLQEKRLGSRHPQVLRLQDEIAIRAKQLDAVGIERNEAGKSNGTSTTPATSLSQAELLYEGKTLSEWLEMLGRERSATGLKSAFAACLALTSPETSDRITQTLLSVLPGLDGALILTPPTDQNSSTTLDDAAYGVLKKANPGPAFSALWVSQFETADENWRNRLWQYSHFGDRDNVEAIEPFLAWCERRLSQAPTGTKAVDADTVKAADYLRSISRDLSGNPATIDRICTALKTSPHLGTAWWLSQPLVYRNEFHNSGSIDSNLWTPAIQSEITRVAVEAFEKNDTSLPLVAQACSILANGAELSQEQRTSVLNSLVNRLSSRCATPDTLTELVPIGGEFLRFSVPQILPNSSFSSTRIQIVGQHRTLASSCLVLELLSLVGKLDGVTAVQHQLDLVLNETRDTLELINSQHAKLLEANKSRNGNASGFGRGSSPFIVALAWPELTDSDAGPGRNNNPALAGAPGTGPLATVQLWGTHEPTARDWLEYLILQHPAMQDSVAAALAKMEPTAASDPAELPGKDASKSATDSVSPGLQ